MHSSAALQLLHDNVKGIVTATSLFAHRQQPLLSRSERSKVQSPDVESSRPAATVPTLSSIEVKDSFRTVTLVGKGMVAAGTSPVYLFTFDLGEGTPFDQNFVCAYYKVYAVDQEGFLLSRPYTPIQIMDESVANSESDIQGEQVSQRRLLRFFIRLYPNGSMSKVLARTKVGQDMRISGPHHSPVSSNKAMRGKATAAVHSKQPPATHAFAGIHRHVAFFAAGTGITSLLQILQSSRSFRDITA